MSQRNTLILLGVFALLLGFLVYTRRTAETEPESRAPAGTGRLWESLASEDIIGIRLIDNETGETVELQKNQEVWEVLQPRSEPADSNRASTAATQLAGLSVTRTLTETTELDGFGVLNPRYTFRVSKEKGRWLAVDIGDKTPVGGGYYALRRGGEHAVIVSSFTVEALAALISEPPYQPTATPEPIPGLAETAEPESAPE